MTNKVVKAAVRIKLGLQNNLHLGNLDATRDWGHAKDYVELQWKILQQKKPDDFVIATGETHSIREFLDEAFSVIEIKDWSKYVVQDQKFMRPAEVDVLRGNPEKAKKLLNWEPKTSFKQLVDIMIKSDVKIIKNKQERSI